MTDRDSDESAQLRAVALSNARSILRARERAERDLRAAKEALERKNQELARSVSLMRATLDSTTDAIFATDGDGNITSMNEKYLAMWDIPRDGDSFRHHSDILDFVSSKFADSTAFRRRVEEIYEEGQPESSDLLELNDGRVIQRHSSMQMVDGHNVGRVWSFRDITDQVRAESDLREQREWFEVTLSSIGDAVITTDVDGRITFMNPVAEKLAGWKAAEARGRDLDEVFHIDRQERHHQQAEEEMGADGPDDPHRFARDGVLRTRDGRYLVVNESTSPIRDAEGQVHGSVIVFHDVTAQRAAEDALREETRALELLNSTGTAIAAQLDLDTLLQMVTDAATSLSGAKFGAFFFNGEDQNGDALMLYILSGAPREAFEKLGHPRPTDIFSPTFRGEGIIRSDNILEDPRYGQWGPHHGMPEGHLPVCSYLAVPVVSRSGEVLGGLFFGHPEVGVFTERSERVVRGIAAQAAIAIDNARLFEAAQVEIISRERAENALREADRRKDEFLAILAHELRNPLAPILQATQILKSERASEDQAAWSHDVIDRQVQHMSLLLDDLLDVSRITRGQLKLRRQWTGLDEIVEAALETVQPLIESREHRLEMSLPDEPTRLYADRLRIAQILANLLTNAAKYTPMGGTIRLEAGAEDGEVVMRVCDNGIGIDSDALPEIFEMFSQTQSAMERSEGGLGIGLALVRGLVELHGGTVDASSGGRGQGSEFTVRIPAKHGTRPETGDESDEKTVPDPNRRQRILIADDNHDSADSMAELLGLLGHEVSVAYDGATAVERFAEEDPDVVVLDIGMPGLNGYEAARLIRETAGDRPVMLIALTGWGQDSDKNRALEAGFDHHFTKPFNTRQFLSLLGEDS